MSEEEAEKGERLRKAADDAEREHWACLGYDGTAEKAREAREAFRAWERRKQ